MLSKEQQDSISFETAYKQFRQSKMEVPLFSDDKKQDSISAKVWLEVFEQRATQLDLSKDRKCMELFLHLRKPALNWWPSLKHHDIDGFSEWEKVKSRFLLDFPPTNQGSTYDFVPQPPKPDLSPLPKTKGRIRRMQSPPPPPPPPRHESSELSKKQQLGLLKSQIRARIAMYHDFAMLEKLTTPHEAEDTKHDSDDNLFSLLDKLSLKTELSRSLREQPKSSAQWPPSKLLAHLPDVVSRTYTIPYTPGADPTKKLGIRGSKIGADPNIELGIRGSKIGADQNIELGIRGSKIGADPNDVRLRDSKIRPTPIGSRPQYLSSNGLTQDQMDMKRCWYCHLVGHLENVCRKRIRARHPQTEPHQRSTVWCLYCCIPGHEDFECRKKIFNESQYKRNKLLGLTLGNGMPEPLPTRQPARPEWTLFRDSVDTPPAEQLAALIKSLN